MKQRKRTPYVFAVFSRLVAVSREHSGFNVPGENAGPMNYVLLGQRHLMFIFTLKMKGILMKTLVKFLSHIDKCYVFLLQWFLFLKFYTFVLLLL